MTDLLTEYYRCPRHQLRVVPKEPLSAVSGYFQLGNEVTCFGKYHGREPSRLPGGNCPEALLDIEIKDGAVHVPFDPSDVVENLRSEAYVRKTYNGNSISPLAELYYFVRPILPISLRKHLQKLYLSGWEKLPFPRWPVDTSIDTLMEGLFLLSIRASKVEFIPFIWFWPEGATSCAVMTHDVETTRGRDSCEKLMDIDDSFGVKAAFQVVPEERYTVGRQFLALIRNRGFEVVIHDLNHDGHLYRTREEFLKRAAKINAYGREYGADGFRAGVLYRRQEWYGALDFAYDMSVPNVAHLDPQRGGCCTVMPYFVGDILELPVTTTQDYTLFNILNEYSLNLWDKQIELIKEKHGLMSFIIHPDYIMGSRERPIYEGLLDRLARLRNRDNIWLAKPGEVNRWWRKRANMQLVETDGDWQIEGDGAEQARIAYASEEDGHLLLSMHAPQGCRDVQMKVR